MLIYLIIVKTKFTPPVFPNTILLHTLQKWLIGINKTLALDQVKIIF